MPPTARYEAPHQQLFRLAVASRRFGLSFDVFWAKTVPAPKRACPRCGSPVSAGKRCTNRRRGKVCGGAPTSTSPPARDRNDQLIPDGVLYRHPQISDSRGGPPAPPDQIGWSGESPDRRAAYTAIAETREAWRRTYDRLPETAGDRALAVLGSALDPAESAAGGDALAIGGSVA